MEIPTISQIFSYVDHTTGHKYAWLVSPFLNMLDSAEIININVVDWYKMQGCHNQINQDHIQHVDKTQPVIIVPINETAYVVIDGSHRLMKHYSDCDVSAEAYLFPLHIANSCRLPDKIAELIHSDQLGDLRISY